MSLQSFPTTHWSLILSAASTGEARSREALAQLCRDYWYPIYSFIRARTQSSDQAQDLTQEFFLYLLNSSILKTADRSAGRFRYYLIPCLKNFLADQSDRSAAQKRGGATVIVPLDLADAESRYASDLQYRETPETAFNRQWAVEVVSHACDELEAALAREGRGPWFRHLKPFLPGGADPPSPAAVAAEMGMSEGAVKVAIHRLRRRYGEVLRASVSHTLADPNDVDEEIRFLLNCLSA
jgi:RNA polymerase sigma factor (sigma-70 family)